MRIKPENSSQGRASPSGVPRQSGDSGATILLVRSRTRETQTPSRPKPYGSSAPMAHRTGLPHMQRGHHVSSSKISSLDDRYLWSPLKASFSLIFLKPIFFHSRLVPCRGPIGQRDCLWRCTYQLWR
ncbi:hypothetical protein CPSG_03239 [Coccidioides posadasii str. Silveira]|uniref:Uncharacterized protein n=1 Tax=Coccidioides posadasii (strain RMSCC 757 / Silveira) TaxID=443226 RepID=E9D160_COCPS|nr:hypothetical protein CPSG_03239 [Coccidioides posadasii str. Silveira]